MNGFATSNTCCLIRGYQVNYNFYYHHRFEAYDLHRTWLKPKNIQILSLTPKNFDIVKVNLNISFITYLIITEKQILYSYDWYSYNLKKNNL